MIVYRTASASRFQTFINRLFQKHSLPFIKETFNGWGNAIRYLARYSFRTAITNSRITEVTDIHVAFRYKDYADTPAAIATSDQPQCDVLNTASMRQNGFKALQKFINILCFQLSKSFGSKDSSGIETIKAA